MSTLLTPIVVQLELDRDRFKALVNGTDTDTVELEGRTELSIAGQVKQRIDDLAFDFTEAKDEVVLIEQNVINIQQNVSDLRDETEDFRNAAFNSATTAEGARDQTQIYHGEVSDWRDEVDSNHTAVLAAAAAVNIAHTEVISARDTTLGYRDQTESMRDAALGAVAEANTILSTIEDLASGALSALDEPLGTSPAALYPTQIIEVDPATAITLIGSSPRPIANNTTFISRRFIIEAYDSVLEEWVLFQNTPSITYHYTLSAGTLSAGTNYRWKCEDTYRAIDTSSNKSYETRTGTWSNISFSADYPYYEVEQPSIISVTEGDNFSVTLQASPIDPNITGRSSVLSVRKVGTNNVVFVQNIAQNFDSTIDLTSFSIPEGILSPSTQYQAYVLYLGDQPERHVSRWSAPFDFTTSSEYSQGKRNKTDLKYGVSEVATLDHSTGNKLYKVNTSNNPDISITSPGVSEYVELFLHVSGEASDGGLTFSTPVVWDTGAFDPSSDLGAEWTLISLKWIGSDWIGKIEAKE